MYYYINSAFSATTYVGNYTGNGERTRTINTHNGKYLILNTPHPTTDDWKIGWLVFVLYGTTLSVSLSNNPLYNITFENNTILIESIGDGSFMNNRNRLYQWAIFT